MRILKWIEVNIRCPSEPLKDEYLTKYVKSILNEYRAKVRSWHFLWEGKPWPSTLRLRFFGDDEGLKQLQQSLEEKLKDIPHCYGEHGECGKDKEDKGEASENWGTKAWEKGMRFLEVGAEFALGLVENKNKLGKSDEYKRDAFFYADRYTHLFLNQIGSLLDEPDFYLTQGISRFSCQIGKELSSNKIRSIVEKTKQKIHSDC